jgi:hypothetical protein
MSGNIDASHISCWALILCMCFLIASAFGNPAGNENTSALASASANDSYHSHDTEKAISGYGQGEVLLTVSIKTTLPVFAGRYNLDIIGINIPPISTPIKVTASKNGYDYDTEGISLPKKPNNFTVFAYGVEDLNIGVRKAPGAGFLKEGFSGQEYPRVWVSSQVKANADGVASIDSDLISPGEYDIKIFGDAKENITSVDLNMSLVKKAVINGRFNLSINTTGFPEGNYAVSMQALNGSLSLGSLAIEDISIAN